MDIKYVTDNYYEMKNKLDMHKKIYKTGDDITQLIAYRGEDDSNVIKQGRLYKHTKFSLAYVFQLLAQNTLGQILSPDGLSKRCKNGLCFFSIQPTKILCPKNNIYRQRANRGGVLAIKFPMLIKETFFESLPALVRIDDDWMTFDDLFELLDEGDLQNQLKEEIISEVIIPLFNETSLRDICNGLDYYKDSYWLWYFMGRTGFCNRHYGTANKQMLVAHYGSSRPEDSIVLSVEECDKIFHNDN